MTRKKLLAHCLSMGIIIAAWMACVLFFATLMGCKPHERVVYQTRTDSVFFAVTDTFTRVVEVIRRDTIESRDSVILREYVTLKVNEGGDTIWRDRVVWRDRWHEREAASVQDSKTAEASTSASEKYTEKKDTAYIREVVETKPALTKRLREWFIVFLAGIVCAVLFVVIRRK